MHQVFNKPRAGQITASKKKKKRPECIANARCIAASRKTCEDTCAIKATRIAMKWAS